MPGSYGVGPRGPQYRGTSTPVGTDPYAGFSQGMAADPRDSTRIYHEANSMVRSAIPRRVNRTQTPRPAPGYSGYQDSAFRPANLNPGSGPMGAGVRSDPGLGAGMPNPGMSAAQEALQGIRNRYSGMEGAAARLPVRPGMAADVGTGPHTAAVGTGPHMEDDEWPGRPPSY